MRHVLGWLVVIVLGCAAGAAAEEEHPDARAQEAQAAWDQALKLYGAGRYADAIAAGEHALALREALDGGAHPETARCLNLLAILHLTRGDFDRAEPLFRRGLQIRETALGSNHPDVAASLNNLGLLYTKQGLYEQAEPLYQRAIAISEAAFGPNHPDVADSLSNLALLYAQQGLYDRAEPLYQRAIALSEAAPDPNQLQLANSLNDLATAYAGQGLYSRAEPLFERALAIQRAALSPNHPDVALSLNNLCSLYTEQGLFGRARPLCKRALAIREAALGKNHPSVAGSLDNLASVYAGQGLYELAGPLHERALAILGAALGKNHLNNVHYINDLALLRLAQHRLADALPLFSRAFAISELRLRHEALGFSESRLANFLQYLRADEEQLYALLRAHPDNADVRRLALSAVLLLKGRSAEETADTSRTVYRNLGAEDRNAFERLRGLRTQLATLSLQGPGALSPADYRQRLKELESRGDALEAELARRSAPLRALNTLPSPADVVDRVAAALPQDGALVEFVAYVDRPLVPEPGTPRSRLPSQQRYLALVLFPGGESRALDLGPAAPMDSAASRLRDALANRDAAFQDSAQALYRLAFQPLLPLLGDTRKLFLASDGQLGLVPFAALHDGRQFLLDSWDFTYLTSGKELLRQGSQDMASPGSVIVLADPDFSVSLQAPASPGQAPGPTERSAAVERFFSTVRADLAERPWTPLPGTRQEAEAIHRVLPQAQLFLGTEATKDRLLHLPTPGVLHLATHGFFLEDAPAPGSTGSRDVGHFGALGEGSLAARPPDPLLRSGLVLAGASASAPDASSPAKAPLDGALVTAMELAGLNLWGTQLVVLSACDTGRGDVRLGQGVYGLRRAFVVAGAETVVMSLWKVNDDTTRLLMESYYRNLLAGQGRARALREAMRWLRLSRPHPHFWAPFIALGRDTPLRALAPSLPGTPEK